MTKIDLRVALHPIPSLQLADTGVRAFDAEKVSDYEKGSDPERASKPGYELWCLVYWRGKTSIAAKSELIL